MLYVLQLVVGLKGAERVGQDPPNSHDCLRLHDLEDCISIRLWRIDSVGQRNGHTFEKNADIEVACANLWGEVVVEEPDHIDDDQDDTRVPTDHVGKCS
jgi:hypothetical protein